jgi:hypothetical protein
VCDEHDLEPHLVERERLERELREARVLVVADAVLDAGVLAVAALHDRDLGVGLVDQDRLEAVAVVVCERQLRAGVGHSRRRITRDPADQLERSRWSVISTTRPFLRSLPS